MTELKKKTKPETAECSPSERLFREIGGISTDLITEAEHSVPVRRMNKVKKWLAPVCTAAACLLLFTGIGFWNGNHAGKLDVITIDSRWNTSEGAMGEPEWAKSADELYRDVPYDESMLLESMPVFKRKYYIDRDTLQYVSYDTEAMKRQLAEYLNMLGTDPDTVSIKLENYLGEPVKKIDAADSIGRMYAETDRFTLNVYADLDGIVTFKEPISLPSEYDLSACASYEDTQKAAGYITDNYSSWLGFEDPRVNLEKVDYEIEGRQFYNITFYEGKSDYKENLVSSNTGKVVIYTDEDGRIDSIRYCPENALENIGDYPLISPEEASRQAEAEGAGDIQKIFLGYNREMAGDEYMLPCYFVVSEYHSPDSPEYFPGQKEFITYCIPAVTSEYLKKVK